MLINVNDLVKIHICQFIKLKFIIVGIHPNKKYYYNLYNLIYYFNMYIFCGYNIFNCISLFSNRLNLYIKIYSLKSRQLMYRKDNQNI